MLSLTCCNVNKGKSCCPLHLISICNSDSFIHCTFSNIPIFIFHYHLPHTPSRAYTVIHISTTTRKQIHTHIHDVKQKRYQEKYKHTSLAMAKLIIIITTFHLVRYYNKLYFHCSFSKFYPSFYPFYLHCFLIPKPIIMFTFSYIISHPNIYIFLYATPRFSLLSSKDSTL